MDDIRERFFKLSARGISPGLEAEEALLENLGNPERDIKTVHIAGTNGKGSVGAFTESVLRCAGFKTARFVSPAVSDWHEMWQSCGRFITDREFEKCASAVLKAADLCAERGIYPTLFEAVTAAAFVFFKMIKADIAVIECGMGGRLDSTNVIPSPTVCALTKIGMDHTAFLGDTEEAVAREKCGIIKRGARVISQRQCGDAERVIKEVCEKNEITPVFCPAPHIMSDSTSGLKFDFESFSGIRTSLCGSWQAENASCAVEICAALRESGFEISDRSIYDGIYSAKWDFRFEIIKRNPYVILDGAHNPDAAARLSESLKRYFRGMKIVYICGMFKDKDYRAVAKLTAPLAERVFTISPPSERGLDADILAWEFERFGTAAHACGSAEEAVRAAAAFGYDVCAVFGSLSFLRQIKDMKEFF